MVPQGGRFMVVSECARVHTRGSAESLLSVLVMCQPQLRLRLRLRLRLLMTSRIIITTMRIKNG